MKNYNKNIKIAKIDYYFIVPIISSYVHRYMENIILGVKLRIGLRKDVQKILGD